MNPINSTNITFSPTSYGNSTYDDTAHEHVWFAVRIIMILGICALFLTLCYLRGKYRQVEDGNIGSLDDRHYQDMHREKRNVIHTRNKIIELTEDGGIKETELSQVKREEGTYYI